MKTKIILLTAGLIALAGAPLPGQEKPARKGKLERLALGKKAEMTGTRMKGTDGKEYSIKDVRGAKGTLVMFSCNTCPWVVAWEDRIASIGNSAKQKGLGYIVINSNSTDTSPKDGMDEMKKRAKKRNFQFPYVMDETSDVARAYGASKTPEVFLFDADLKLVYHGAIDDNAKNPDEVEEAYLEDAIDALLAGEEIAKKETKALGCTIKFRPAKEQARGQ